jgi:hypothetical protein
LFIKRYETWGTKKAKEAHMSEAKTCHQCGQGIDLLHPFARLKNPAVGEIDYLYFHQRGRGDCYWQYLRETIIKAQIARAAEATQGAELEIQAT